MEGGRRRRPLWEGEPETLSQASGGYFSEFTDPSMHLDLAQSDSLLTTQAHPTTAPSFLHPCEFHPNWKENIDKDWYEDQIIAEFVDKNVEKLPGKGWNHEPEELTEMYHKWRTSWSQAGELQTA